LIEVGAGDGVVPRVKLGEASAKSAGTHRKAGGCDAFRISSGVGQRRESSAFSGERADAPPAPVRDTGVRAAAPWISTVPSKNSSAALRNCPCHGSGVALFLPAAIFRAVVFDE